MLVLSMVGWVEPDTLGLRPASGVVLKQFPARDRISRWDVLEAHGRVTSTASSRFLDSLEHRLPFHLRSLQVHGSR